MRALKIAITVMGVLIVAGTVTLVTLIARRSAPSSAVAASVVLDEPEGTRIGGVSLLADRLGAPRYVHVTRTDKVAQAVSLWRAVQTRAWRAGERTEVGDATYHAGAIGYLASELSDQDDAWRRWFAANGIRPLTIEYDDLAVDTHGTTARVLDHLGVGPADIPEPPLRRFSSTGSVETITPRPRQCSHGSENTSSRPWPTRLRVIWTRPSEVTSATWWRVRSRPRASVNRRNTSSRLDSSTMSMKSMTMMPPISRSRS